MNWTELTYEVFPFMESALKYRECSAAKGHENRYLCWGYRALSLNNKFTEAPKVEVDAPKPNWAHFASPLNGRLKNASWWKASVGFRVLFLRSRSNFTTQPRRNANIFIWESRLKWSSEQISHWYFMDLLSVRRDIIGIGSWRSARRWIGWLWNRYDMSAMTRHG